MQAAGVRGSSVAGETLCSALQPTMGLRVQTSTPNTKGSGESRPAIRARGAAAMHPKPALHGHRRDRPAAVRRPRPHRGSIATRS
jgi:hypothetical protein